MGFTNCLVTNTFQNTFFRVQQKKEFHTGLEELWIQQRSFFYLLLYTFLNCTVILGIYSIL